MWSPIIAAMSSSYRCYFIDTITEANKSVATKRIHSVADHVDWLGQVFAAIDLASARVMGMSYGGWLAAQLALHEPERVSHLVLLTPAGTLAPLPLRPADHHRYETALRRGRISRLLHLGVRAQVAVRRDDDVLGLRAAHLVFQLANQDRLAAARPQRGALVVPDLQQIPADAAHIRTPEVIT